MLTIFFTNEEIEKPQPIDTLKKIINLYLDENDQHPAIVAKRQLAEQINKIVKLIK